MRPKAKGLGWVNLIGRCSTFFFFQAEDGIRDLTVTGVQTCALPIFCRVWQPRDAWSSIDVAEFDAEPPVYAERSGRSASAKTAARQARPTFTPVAREIGRESCRERV